MTIRYALLLAAAAGLASCSNNSTQPEEAGRPTAALSQPDSTARHTADAARALPGTPAPHPTADSGAAARYAGPGLGSLTPATADAGPVPRAAARTTEAEPKDIAAPSRPQHLHRARWRGPTTLADAQPREDSDQGTAATLDSMATAELGRFLATGLPPTRRFVVRPGRDTVVVGPQGTQMLLPARIWDGLPAADSNAVVRLDLQEFYSAADMLLAGLSTTAGPNLLETGGMLRLTATANGRPVRLRPGRVVYLRMPTKKAKPGMQLFEGVANGHQQAVDWQLPGSSPGSTPGSAAGAAAPGSRRRVLRRRQLGPAQHSDSTYVAHPETQWPEYQNFENQLRAQLPQPGRLRRNRDNTAPTKDVLNELSQAYDERIVRYVSLNFTIDSTGALGQLVPRQGSDPELTPAISALLLQTHRWKPAGLPHFVKRQVAYEPMAATGAVQVNFARSGKIFVTRPTWSVPRAGKARAQQLKHEVDSLLASKAFRRQYRFTQDSLAVVRRGLVWAQYQAEQARLRTQFTDTSRAPITQQGVYNELSAQGLGWINCDRFVQGMVRIRLRVPSPGEAAVTSLLFKDINCVMRGEPDTDNFVAFNKVPPQVQATIVAIKRKAGITYLATQTLLTTPTPVSSLRFHPVTMAQLRAELAALN